MYFDKRLKKHNLLQAIARVNRVVKNKNCGFNCGSNEVWPNGATSTPRECCTSIATGREFCTWAAHIVCCCLPIKPSRRFFGRSPGPWRESMARTLRARCQYALPQREHFERAINGEGGAATGTTRR